MRATVVLAVLLSLTAGCAFLEPSGCDNVRIDFEPVEEVGAFFVNVTTASLQQHAPDLAPHVLDAVSGNATGLSVPEEDYAQDIRLQLLAVDPERAQTWVHPDGIVRVDITMC